LAAKIRGAIIFVLALLLQPASAGATSELAQSGPSKTNGQSLTEPAISVRSGTLPNGFRYVIAPTRTGSKTTSMTLVVGVGHSDATGEQIQVPHVLEHLLIRGFPTSTGSYVTNSELGRSWGADDANAVRAETSLGSTTFSFKSPNDDVSRALYFLRTIAHGRNLDSAEIRSETQVVLSEVMLRTDDRSPFSLAIQSVGPSRLIGDSAEVRITRLKQMTPERVTDFYAKWYRANIQTLYIAGDIDADAIETIIVRLFSDIPNGAPIPTKIFPPLDVSNGFVRFAPHLNATTATLLLDYEYSDARAARSTGAEAVRIVLAKLIDSQLAKRRKFFGDPILHVQIASDQSLWRKSARGIDLQFSATEGRFEAAATEVFGGLKEVAAGRFDVNEVDELKTRIANFMPSSPSQKCAQPDDILQSLIADESNLGVIHCEKNLTKRDFELVTAKALRLEMSRLLDRRRIGFFAIVPANDSKVGKIQALNALARSRVANRESGRGLPVPALRSRIGAIAKHFDAPLTPVAKDFFRTKGRSGFHIYLRESAPSERFVLQIFGRGINDLSVRERSSAGTVVQIAKLSGFGGLTGGQLAQYVRNNGLAYEIKLDPLQSLVEVSGPNDRLSEAASLLDQILIGPNKNTPAVAEYRRRAEAVFASDDEVLDSILSRTVRLGLDAPLTWAEARRLSVIPSDTDMALVWSNLFGDVRTLTAVASGGRDEQMLVASVDEIFSKHSGARMQSADVVTTSAPRSAKYNHVYRRGYGPESRIRLVLPLTVAQHRTKPVLTGLQTVFGSRSRFYNRIRVVEAGAYSPIVSFEIDSARPNRILMIIKFVCDPKDTDRLVDAVWDEIGDIQKKGLKPDEIARLSQAPLSSTSLSNAEMVQIIRQFPGRKISPDTIAVDPATSEELIALIRAQSRNEAFLFEAAP